MKILIFFEIENHILKFFWNLREPPGITGKQILKNKRGAKAKGSYFLIAKLLQKYKSENCADCCTVSKQCLILCNCLNYSTPVTYVLTVSWSLLKLMSIKSVILSNISSSVVPLSSYPQSFPASGSLPMSSSHQVAKVLTLEH